ncbi:low molecular weight phosphotyrosine protein phosphatase [Flavobacterium amniphilum]|uniref:low molecular weight protein-tyrosine-phosphatase n=1 Tax=Flavobacterium amniphilum TaxID=1834035 RepID=UPI00202A84BD|nr:low molecular weight protein-tyrosine-phosphatase [Flavobacterium amniphilum]MCL9806129.1 low molecular weight phosphotyrosine protein phosphatase [Flavobacterium amniphilum]
MTTKILMVCLGNICRSPLAEGILRSKLSNDYIVDSAGTGSWHVGQPPDKRSVLTAKNYNLDITHLRGRHFSKKDFQEFDYIYVMDNQNYKDVIAQAQNNTDKAKVQLILDEIFPGERVDVPDPYYGQQDGFEKVYHMLDKACDSIAQKLLKK